MLASLYPPSISIAFALFIDYHFIILPQNPNALPNLDTIEGDSLEILFRYPGDRTVKD